MLPARPFVSELRREGRVGGRRKKSSDLDIWVMESLVIYAGLCRLLPRWAAHRYCAAVK
jgi:hypothetical protein